MNQIYRTFYRAFYMRTSGFIPTVPSGWTCLPGDLFQIINGEMIVHGNIYQNSLIDAASIDLSHRASQNPADWNFSEGTRKVVTQKSDEADAVNQHFSFDSAGSFFFASKDQQSVKIQNWREIADELILKLTTMRYSFREIYVVVESAKVSGWALAISASDKGQLEINADLDGLPTSTIAAKDIEYHHRDSSGHPSFLKAKKLVVKADELDPAVWIAKQASLRESGVLKEHVISVLGFEGAEAEAFERNVAHPRQVSVLDLLSSGELNPNTALRYFRWEDADLDDIERLFSN